MKTANGKNFGTIFLALGPLMLLGLVIGLFLSGGPTKIFQTNLPAVEQLHVLRHTLHKDEIKLEVINSGPDPVTIAQVMVRGAFWYHEITPKRNLNPLEKAEVVIPYPWNVGEPIGILLLTSTGLTFDYEIEVASITPSITLTALGRFALLGVYVGVIPVFLGICWFPFLRRLGKTGLGFFIYLTVGLLAFLVVDTIGEGLELTASLPGVFHAPALFILGLAGTYLTLLGVESSIQEKRGSSSFGVILAWIVALGIGLHNLGEGLTIGSAYVLGELTLGAMLVLGFTMHNATEGIAIVAPILQDKPKLSRLIGLGALAGAPTILGCWIGAFNYSPVWSLLFFGIGAGAILQVIAAILGRYSLKDTLHPVNLAGLLTGYLIMYFTGFWVGSS
jgi:zinc transporter ZupT